MPKRIQLRRTKGWRKPYGAVVVARGTRFGNPFPVERYGASLAVQLHRRWITGSKVRPIRAGNRTYTQPTRADLDAIRGRDLACWCKPGEPCHADTLLEIANTGAP